MHDPDLGVVLIQLLVVEDSQMWIAAHLYTWYNPRHLVDLVQHKRLLARLMNWFLTLLRSCKFRYGLLTHLFLSAFIPFYEAKLV